MKNSRSWLKLVAKSLILGFLLVVLLKFIIKLPYMKSLEYIGVVFLFIAVVFFMTTGPRKYRNSGEMINATMEPKNKKEPVERGDIYYVLAFGLVGLVFILLPLFIR